MTRETTLPTRGIHNLYAPKRNEPARVAAFMSGSGTNVQRVLELEEMLEANSPFNVVAIVTDTPGSNAEKIKEEQAAKGKKIEVVCLDIKEYYRDMGLNRVSIKTQEGQDIREQYTFDLWRKIWDFGIDLGVFGGFEPLTNIVEYFPCLNVHPGDLTYMKDGKRHLVGLHTVPIQRALDEKLEYVRSSVILATPYTGAGENMDDGPIIAIGPKLIVGEEKDAKKIQNRLKEVSDWIALPYALREVAMGRVIVDFDTKKVYHGAGEVGVIIDHPARQMND